MNDYRQVDLWRLRHLYCTDIPNVMSPEEASYVLRTHAGHGGGCAQFSAAMRQTSPRSAA